MSDLVERLRALSRAEHDDLSIGDEAADELSRLRALTEWRPIETAPKDGTRALVFRPRAVLSGDEPMAVKRLIGGNHHCWEQTVPAGETPTNPTDGACHVTHWLPLPPPPEKK